MSFQRLPGLVEQCPQLRRWRLTDALLGLVQRKRDKLDAPAEPLRRTEASHRRIQQEQFVADVEASPRGLVVRRQPQRGLKIPLRRAIVASCEFRLAQAGPGIRVRGGIVQDRAEYIRGPGGRSRQEEHSTHSCPCLQIAGNVILNLK